MVPFTSVWNAGEESVTVALPRTAPLGSTIVPEDFVCDTKARVTFALDAPNGIVALVNAEGR